MPKHFNVVGPQVRRLRSAREWSQNDLATKLQILGLESATRVRISKIESRRACVSDDELIYLSRVLGVSTEELYPDFIRAAKRLYDAIAMSKASRYGAFIFGLLSCSKIGAAVVQSAATIASV